jgi:hypothetical protein
MLAKGERLVSKSVPKGPPRARWAWAQETFESAFVVEVLDDGAYAVRVAGDGALWRMTEEELLAKYERVDA